MKEHLPKLRICMKHLQRSITKYHMEIVNENKGSGLNICRNAKVYIQNIYIYINKCREEPVGKYSF